MNLAARLRRPVAGGAAGAHAGRRVGRPGHRCRRSGRGGPIGASGICGQDLRSSGRRGGSGLIRGVGPIVDRQRGRRRVHLVECGRQLVEVGLQHTVPIPVGNPRQGRRGNDHRRPGCSCFTVMQRRPGHDERTACGLPGDDGVGTLAPDDLGDGPEQVAGPGRAGTDDGGPEQQPADGRRNPDHRPARPPAGLPAGPAAQRERRSGQVGKGRRRLGLQRRAPEFEDLGDRLRRHRWKQSRWHRWQRGERSGRGRRNGCTEPVQQGVVLSHRPHVDSIGRFGRIRIGPHPTVSWYGMRDPLRSTARRGHGRPR